MFSRIFPLCILISFSAADASFADDSCGFLPARLRPLEEGQLFASGKAGWQAFDTLSELVSRAPEEMDFAYVIGTQGAADRTGVLVVKTNRPVSSTDNEQLRRRVMLVRREVGSDLGCPAVVGPASYKTSVSTESFRDYHDFPPRGTAALRQAAAEGSGTEFDVLRNFHFWYRSVRKRDCVRTDNNEYDDFPSSQTSNRAQFSFDKTVVVDGSYGILRLFWRPASPFEGAADHRVLVRKYATQGGLACVRFSVPLRSADYTFRVNDLESQVTGAPNRRKAEVSQTLPDAR